MQQRVQVNYTNIVLLNCRQEGMVEETESNDNKKGILEKRARDHSCLRLKKKGKSTFKDYNRWHLFLQGTETPARHLILSQCHEGFQCNLFGIQFLVIAYENGQPVLTKKKSLVLLLSSAALVCACSSLGNVCGVLRGLTNISL